MMQRGNSRRRVGDLIRAVVFVGVLACGVISSAEAPTSQDAGWDERLTLVRLTSATFTDPLQESDVVYAYRHAAGPGMLITQWYMLRDDPEKVDLDALAAELRADPTLLRQRFVLGTEYWDGPGERWTREAADPSDTENPHGELAVHPDDLAPSRHRYADAGAVLTGWLSVIELSLLDVVTDAPKGEKTSPNWNLVWTRSEDGSKLNVTIRREHHHLVGGVPLWVTLRAGSFEEYDELLRQGPDERDRLSHATFEATFERNTGADAATTPFRRVQFTAENHPRGQLEWEQKGLAVLVHSRSHPGDAKTFRERCRPLILDGTPVMLLNRSGLPADGVPRVWRDGAIEINDAAVDAVAMSQLAASNPIDHVAGAAISGWVWVAGGATVLLLGLAIALVVRRGSHESTRH
jgi:hypothetical protein